MNEPGSVLACPCCGAFLTPCDCQWETNVVGNCQTCYKCATHCACPGIRIPVAAMPDSLAEVAHLRSLLKRAYQVLEAVAPEERDVPEGLNWDLLVDVMDELKKEVGE